MLLFLLSRWLWQTGIGGSISLVIAYVFSVTGIFRLVRTAPGVDPRLRAHKVRRMARRSKTKTSQATDTNITNCCIALLPFGKFGGVVNGPRIRDVMHGADEIIPRMPRGEFANPILVAGQIIHFQREPDGQLREIPLRLADFVDVFVQPIRIHPPVRRNYPAASANGRKSRFPSGRWRRRALRIPPARPRRMAAERRVHVIIRRQRHAEMLVQNDFWGQQIVRKLLPGDHRPFLFVGDNRKLASTRYE